MLLLEIKGLSFLDYGPFELSLDSGEVFGISGTSGSGKTLLLKALADLIESKGEVKLDGAARESITGPEWRQRVMLVPSEPAWWFEKVGEHFPDAGRPFDCEGLGLPAGVLDWPVSQLSSGEKQRLGLARALACNPKVLLLDEPTANLDEKNTELVEQCLLGLLAETGIAAIWVSHNREQLKRVATRQAVIANKKLNFEEVSL